MKKSTRRVRIRSDWERAVAVVAVDAGFAALAFWAGYGAVLLTAWLVQ